MSALYYPPNVIHPRVKIATYSRHFKLLPSPLGDVVVRGWWRCWEGYVVLLCCGGTLVGMKWTIFPHDDEVLTIQYLPFSGKNKKVVETMTARK